jgi:hypothetical protein
MVKMFWCSERGWQAASKRRWRASSYHTEKNDVKTL